MNGLPDPVSSLTMGAEALTSDKMDAKTIGNIGEKVFSAAVEWEGLICLSSKENDVLGWDFSLTDRLPSASVVRQIIRPTTEYKVQIKTSKASRGPTLKLSTVRDLIECQNPSFVVTIRVEKTTIVEAVIYHLHHELIEFAMKAIREHSSNGADLNQIRISIPKKMGVKLLGENVRFKEHFRQCVDASPKPYALQKFMLADQVGLQFKRQEFRIPLDQYAKVFENGLFPVEVTINDLKTTEVHWGIETDVGLAKDVVQIIAPNKIGNAIIEFENKGERLTFLDAEEFHLPNHLTGVDHYSYRNRFFNIVIADTRNSISASVGTLTTLNDIAKMMRACKMMASPECLIKFRSRTHRGTIPVGENAIFRPDTDDEIMFVIELMSEGFNNRFQSSNAKLEYGDLIEIYKTFINVLKFPKQGGWLASPNGKRVAVGDHGVMIVDITLPTYQWRLVFQFEIEEIDENAGEIMVGSGLLIANEVYLDFEVLPDRAEHVFVRLTAADIGPPDPSDIAIGVEES